MPINEHAITETNATMKKTLLAGIAALFLATGTAHAGKIVLQYDQGGLMQQYIDLYRNIANAGMDVEIRGRCISACTQIMMFVPSKKICFDKRGTLEFHMARTSPDGKLRPSPIWTEWMWIQFPENIRTWLKGKGWVEKATIENYWVLTSEDLWAMGYRKCESDDPFEDIPSTSYPPRPGSGPSSGG